jgi:tryptophan synthase beta chain
VNELDKSLVPTHWSNFVFDHPAYAAQYRPRIPEALRGSARHLSIIPQQPISLAKQSINTSDRWIPIPEEILRLYYQYRPTPLRRAGQFEEKLGTNCRVYYKFEGANISGSHKLNTALAQAYYYRRAGIKHLVTGTGAGQWGTAIAYACKRFDLECTVFMVQVSLRQKPQREMLMELFGATVHASPSDVTSVGREIRSSDPEATGTLATATGEALELARQCRDTRFAVGSGENYVLLHQSIIGSEAVAQMSALGDFPDYVVACMGAGSNFAGVGLPFVRAARERKRSVRLLAVEPSASPKLTRGRYAYDVSDFSGTTPVSKMYTVGSGYTPPPIYAGGLRYHGTSPFLSALYADRMFSALAVDQPKALEAGLMFAEMEGILPAPESAYAIAGAMHLARDHSHRSEPLVILINISGHGLLDMDAYLRLRSGDMEVGRPDEKHLAASLRQLSELNRMMEESLRRGG